MLALKRPLSPAVHMSLRIVLALLFIAAVILRISLYQVQTSDYTFFVSQWYDFIKTHGGFAAFKTNFSNYNVPYLYVLALTTFLPIPKLIAIKTTSVMFDALLALFTYLILNLRYKGSYLPIIGTLVVLFAPTIFINSAAWGQADATYAAFCLGSLYFLLKERPGWACAFFAIAISFKLQAVFFAPVLLIVLLKRRLPLKDLAKYLALIPLIFLLFLVPAFIAGRDAWSLVTIYAGQVNTGGAGGGFGGQFNGRGAGGAGGFNGGTGGGTGGFTRGAGGAGGFPGGGFRGAGGTGGFPGGGFTRGAGGFGGRNFASSSLTLNAPSMYQWFPANTPDGWKWLGIILAGAVVVVVAALVWRSKEKFTSAILLKVALVFALALPFLLPEMHERYFYLADVLSIVYAFYFPRYFFVPILVQLCSLLSYAPYFWNRQVVGLSYVAFVELVVIIIVFTNLVLTLYPDLRKRKEASLAPTSEVSSEVTEVADGAVPS